MVDKCIFLGWLERNGEHGQRHAPSAQSQKAPQVIVLLLLASPLESSTSERCRFVSKVVPEAERDRLSLSEPFGHVLEIHVAVVLA